MTVAFRVADSMDLRDVLAIERSTPELPHWSNAEYERYVATAAMARDRVIFVAEDAEVIVGFAAASLSFSNACVAELESIAVLPGQRRSGIGRELCRTVIRWSRDRAAETVELEVRSRSAEAIALYRAVGFRELGTRSRYYANPADDALRMALVLRARCAHL